MKTLYFVLPFLFNSPAFAQDKECNTSKEFDLKPTLKTYNVSYNDGKKKRLHGNYKDGQKVGIWSYYDSDGKLLLKRNYFNNLSYESVFPKIPKHYKEVGVGMVASEKRDSLEILPYFYVQEKDVTWSSRFYQLNWFKDHESLVSVEILQAAFSQLLQDKSITKYRSMDFRDTFSFPAENLNDYNIIGFLSKTDAFFDAVRQLGEMRTIGIQPLALNSFGDTILLPVMYYPQVRKNLSSFTIKSYDYVQHVDDLFYFSLFDGPIYSYFSKENNLKTAYLSRFENENCFSHKEMSFIREELENYIRYFNGVAH